MNLRNLRASLGACAMLVGAACNSDKNAPKTPLAELTKQEAAAAASPAGAPGVPALPREALVALDSGNALYRLKKYPDALAQYRLASTRAPDDGAAYFGIYMVAEATKNKPLLDSAVALLKAHGMSAPAGVHK